MKLVGLIQSSFSKHLQNLKSALSASKMVLNHLNGKTACEMYAVLINQGVYAAENCDKAKQPANAKAKNSNSTFRLIGVT